MLYCRNIVVGGVVVMLMLAGVGGCQNTPKASPQILISSEAGSYLRLARTDIENGQYELAEQKLAISRQLDPENGQVYYLSGDLFRRLNQLELAFENYQRAANKTPTEPAYVLAEAKMLVAMGRMPEAIILLHARSSDFHSNAVFCDAFGQLLLQSHNYMLAAEQLRLASNLAAGDPKIARRFAQALYASGRYQECVGVIRKLIAQQSVNDRVTLLIMLGYSLDQLGRHPEAVTCYQLALTINPSDSTATQMIATIDLDDRKD